ncbi:MAG: DNA methyltransferase, partial [Methanosarcinales archaeon]
MLKKDGDTIVLEDPNSLEEEVKDLDKVKPVEYGVIAKPHTPIYKMHRYFARRPYTVFNYLIKHYSNVGDIIFDPFCGGGVTVIEGLRLRRKVIGVDINPIATFITRMEAIDLDLEKLEHSFKKINKKVGKKIKNLYTTKCPDCNKKAEVEWFEWSKVVACPNCRKEVILSEVEKVSGGKYKCNICNKEFYARDGISAGEVIIGIKTKCAICGFKGVKKPEEYDFKKYNAIIENFDNIIEKEGLWYPKDEIFLGEKTKELLTKGYKYFYELFTKRNLLALSILHKYIKKIKPKKIRNLMELVFTSGLYESSILSHIKGTTVVKPGHHYWLPDIFSEVNIMNYFATRFKPALKGKTYSKEEIGDYYKEANNFEELKKDKTCRIINKSSTYLSLSEIPDNSVDVVITDPPYGDNVNYTELSNFWAIWIKEILGLKEEELIDNKEEAIINKYQNKGLKEYRDLIYRVLKECHRVLKPNRWLIMTFHNKNFKVWSSLHLAAHDAGFTLPEDGIIYQPPIKSYTTTLHQRSEGSMLGDFILSFKRVDEVPELSRIEEAEIGSKIRKKAGEIIRYHGGARLSTIYSGLVNFLAESGYFHKVAQKDLTQYLKKDFIEVNGKWYFKEDVDVEG